MSTKRIFVNENRMNALCVDTNILIKLLDGNELVAEILKGKLIVISEFTEIELLCKPNATRTQTQLIQSLIKDCFVIRFDEEVKQRSIKMRKSFGLGLLDCFISSTAFVNGFPFLTPDREFGKLSKEMEIILLD